jgi:8-oxo-dGTP pyrophosphatase MutT (NUDIX family)
MPQPQPTQRDSPPTLDFEIDDSLTPWNLPGADWISKHDKPWDALATGCVIINPQGNILLIQRASHDSLPNMWEIPGGAVDREDVTVFHGAARELWEEAGLVAKRFTHFVTEGPDREPGQTYTNRTGERRFCRFSFNVEVQSCEGVRLDPMEHQDYVWATEEEVRAQRIGDREVLVTNSGMLSLILEAFRLSREEAAKTMSSGSCNVSN